MIFAMGLFGGAQTSARSWPGAHSKGDCKSAHAHTHTHTLTHSFTHSHSSQNIHNWYRVAKMCEIPLGEDALRPRYLKANMYRML